MADPSIREEDRAASFHIDISFEEPNESSAVKKSFTVSEGAASSCSKYLMGADQISVIEVFGVIIVIDRHAIRELLARDDATVP